MLFFFLLFLTRFFTFFVVFLYFWHCGFKTVVIVNPRKTNRRKPKATCTCTPHSRTKLMT